MPNLSLYDKFQEIPRVSSDIIVDGELLNLNIPGFSFYGTGVFKSMPIYGLACNKTNTRSFIYGLGNKGHVQDCIFCHENNSLKLTKSRIIFGIAEFLGLDYKQYTYDDLIKEIDKKMETFKNISNEKELEESFPIVYEKVYMEIVKTNRINEKKYGFSTSQIKNEMIL